MTDTPTLDVSLLPVPHGRTWWQRLMWWVTAGELELREDRLRVSRAGHASVTLDLMRPVAAHLHVWPRDTQTAWVSLRLVQDTLRAEIQTWLAWSSFPEDLPTLISQSPAMRPGHFLALWEALRLNHQAHGRALPRLGLGLYSGRPRGLEHLGHLHAPGMEPPPRDVHTYAYKSRSDLKRWLRTLERDQFVRCRLCGAEVKVKNMIRHVDREHRVRR